MQIKVGTRKSPLAIKQTEMVCKLLSANLDNASIEIVPISTEIDSHLNYSLENQGGQGLFTKELDEALLEKSIDIAVHSSKDLPIELNLGIKILGYLPRASAADILISSKPFEKIQTIATSSPRRKTQLKKHFPNAEFSHIRGNVQTRLDKLTEGVADASILAEAGLDRLGIETHKDLSFTHVETEILVPAAGQGAIVSLVREEFSLDIQALFCNHTHQAVSLEKECLAILDGSCQSPTGIYFDGSKLHLFHPKLGYKCFNKEDQSFNEFRSFIFQELNSFKKNL